MEFSSLFHLNGILTLYTKEFILKCSNIIIYTWYIYKQLGMLFLFCKYSNWLNRQFVNILQYLISETFLQSCTSVSPFLPCYLICQTYLSPPCTHSVPVPFSEVVQPLASNHLLAFPHTNVEVIQGFLWPQCCDSREGIWFPTKEITLSHSGPQSWIESLKWSGTI